MKKIFKFFGITVLACIVALGTTGCFFDGSDATKVSSFEELKSARGGNIILTDDIDCGYETMEPFGCGEFDGQGHVIKNCIITFSADYVSFFRSGVGTIEKVTFENITVVASNALSAAIVSAGETEKIDNVHVKNSKLSCTQGDNNYTYGSYAGGIYGGYYPTVDSSPTCKISNCTVSGLEIEQSGYESSYKSGKPMYVGGIAGGCNNISNCSVVDSKITSTSTMLRNYPYVGGIVGYSEGSIENSYTKNNSFTAVANYYEKRVFSLYLTSRSYLGGIAAYVKGNGNIKYCHGDNNVFNADCSGSIYVGGLIGYVDGTSVTQSYTKSTYISMDKYADGNKDAVYRRAGGLIGASFNNLITSCFAYNDNVLIEQSSGVKSTDSKVAGLIAGFDSISVMNCATYNRELTSAGMTDEFIPSEFDGISQCYVSAVKFGNVNNVEVVSESFWYSPNTVKNNLNLMGVYWHFTTDNLPYLEYEITE